MYNGKAHYVDNFNDFLIMISLNVVFRNISKKRFIIKENTFNQVDLHINQISRF